MVPSIAIRRWESAEPKVKLWLKNKHKYVIQNIQINSLPSKVYSHNSTHATVSTELFKLYYFVSPFSFLHLFLNTVLFWLDYSRLFPQSHFPFLCDYVTIFSFCRLRRRKRKMCVKEFVAISVNLLFFFKFKWISLCIMTPQTEFLHRPGRHPSDLYRSPSPCLWYWNTMWGLKKHTHQSLLFRTLIGTCANMKTCKANEPIWS